MPIDPLLRPVLDTFRREADSLRQIVTRALIELERPASGESERAAASAELSRALHTLKGTSATFGLQDLTELAHRMEEIGLRAIGSEQRLAPAQVDVLLKALDTFRVRLEAYAQERDAELPPISNVLTALDDAAASPTGDDAGLQPEQAQAPSFTTAELDGWRVSDHELAALTKQAEQVRELKLRIDDRVQQLGLMVSDLGNAHSRDAVRAILVKLAGAHRALECDAEDATSVVRGLDDSLHAMRTLPVSALIAPFERTVRDLVRASGKQAKLSLAGGDLAIDRRLLEGLRGPLLHLLRNAADHGIEEPERRVKLGKPAEGAIVVGFRQLESVLEVEVSDDGAGLDVDAILEEAVRRQLVTREASAMLSERELWRIIFERGFSTRAQVSQTSGRGVGLDVVRSQVALLGGSVDLTSRRDAGTRFVLRLPLEIGAVPVLVVRLGELRFGLPLVAVEAVLLARTDSLQVSEGRAWLEHRGELVPIKDLGALLEQRAPSTPERGQPLVVVAPGGRRVAFAVDDILGDRELALRQLPEELRGIFAYQGAAALASGEPLLVLRPDWIAGAKQPDSIVRRALVVDDSITARAMHRTSLESGGFFVHVASSAEQALAKLRGATYAVVVCDLFLGGMDGVAFVERLRQDAAGAAIPVLIVSVSSDEAVKRRVLAAGADAFLTKAECAAGALLGEVEAVIAKRRASL